MSTEQDREAAERPSAGSTKAAAFDDGSSSFEDGSSPFGDGEELEARAMLAAERALAAGQQALEAAEAAGAFAMPRSRIREWVLRGLLAFNLLLMAAVLLLPDAARQADPAGAPAGDMAGHRSPVSPAGGDLPALAGGQRRGGGHRQAVEGPVRRPARSVPVPLPETDDRYARAMLRAASGDLTGAVEDLERYLAAEPHMPPAMKRNVLGTLAHYSFRLGLEQEAREFERRASALTQSHYLPEDLVRMARRAEEEGDGDRMRRLYARFVLQQKQVPPSLHHFLAEAYLKLGDSYRIEAERGAQRSEARRSRDLQAVTPPRGRGK